MIVINLKTGEPHEVWKYLKSCDGQESIWCNDWYGHHVIGVDCVFPTKVEYSSTQNNELVIPHVIKSVCDKCEELQAELNRCYEAMDSKKGING